ncbi:unnamed protein product [Camellia sinensis]
MTASLHSDPFSVITATLVTDPSRAMNISDISGENPEGKSVRNGLSESDLQQLIDLANNREGTTEQSPVSFSALASRLQALKDAIKVDLPLTPKSRVVDPHECRDLSSQPVLGLDLGDTSQIAAVSSLKWSAMVDSENLRFGNVQDSLVRTKAKGLATASAEEYIPVGDIIVDNLQGMNLSSLATKSDKENDIQVRRVAEIEGFPQQNLHQGGRGQSSYRGGRGRGGRGNPNSLRVDYSAVASNQTTKSWAEVATMPSRSSIKLRYIPPPASDDPNVVDLPFREMGKLKRLIQPRDITINIGKDAPILECPIPGERWKEIRHDNTVTWLAFWNDRINPKEFKYVFLAASSSLKGQSDMEKYEKLRMLKDYIQGIRATYTKDFASKDITRWQIAVATYLIDKLALRAGNDKDDDEADTIGCCTLKVENVELEYDEWTGEQKLQYNDAPEDIEPEEIRPMGNYAVSITWPDGFTQRGYFSCKSASDGMHARGECG